MTGVAWEGGGGGGERTVKLEVTSVVCGVGTEVDRDELGAGSETTDSDDCGASVSATGTGSASIGGDESVSGCGSWGVGVGSEAGEAVSSEGWESAIILTRPASKDGSTGGSRVCVTKGDSATGSPGVTGVGSAFGGRACSYRFSLLSHFHSSRCVRPKTRSRDTGQ